MVIATRQKQRPSTIKLVKPERPRAVEKIDSLSKRLIKLLEKDARQNSEVLARQLGVSSATVRRRLRALIKGDAIRIVAVVNPDKLELPLAVVMGFDVVLEKLTSTAQALANLPQVKWVLTTTGRFNILALTLFSSLDELDKFLQTEIARIEGLKDSEVSICLRKDKMNYVYGI